MARIVAAILLVVFSLASRAETSGNDLQAACRGRNQSYCLGYIEGATDAQGAWQWIMSTRLRPELEPSAPLYCIPDEVTLDQMQQVVMKYLRDNPASLHRSAEVLIRAALNDAFPCVCGPTFPESLNCRRR